jgi:hypothetical protein
MTYESRYGRKKVMVSCYLHKDQAKKLAEVARIENVYQAQIVRDALDLWFVMHTPKTGTVTVELVP